MVKQKRPRAIWVGVCALFLVEVARAEQPQAPQQNGGQGQQQININPQPAAGANNIKIWDDRVFDLNGSTQEPESRTSVGGSRRYLDKTKELDYNTEQRDRWMKSCASLRESNYKAFGDCVEAQKKKELGSRTNFGAREPRSGSDGLNKPLSGAAGLQGIQPTPSDLKPRLPEDPESGGGGGSDVPDLEGSD